MREKEREREREREAFFSNSSTLGDSVLLICARSLSNFGIVFLRTYLKRSTDSFRDKNAFFFYKRERRRSGALMHEGLSTESTIRPRIVNRFLIAKLDERSYSFGPIFAAIAAESQAAEPIGERSIR